MDASPPGDSSAPATVGRRHHCRVQPPWSTRGINGPTCTRSVALPDYKAWNLCRVPSLQPPATGCKSNGPKAAETRGNRCHAFGLRPWLLVVLGGGGKRLCNGGNGVDVDRIEDEDRLAPPAAASAARCAASRSASTGGAVGSRARSPPPPSTVTRTQVLLRTSASTVALSAAKPSTLFPYQAYQVFHVCTCCTVASSILGPCVPTISGTARAGVGCCRTRSRSTAARSSVSPARIPACSVVASRGRPLLSEHAREEPAELACEPVPGGGDREQRPEGDDRIN